jgi:predicted GNAT family N-acyltransferase
MKDGIRFAITDDERKAVYQLRYEVYVEGMGRLKEKSDVNNKELRDEYDQTAHTVVAIKNDKAIGTLRLFRGGDTHFDQYLTNAYHLSPFTKHLDDSKICIIERLMVDEKHRGSTVMLRMYREVMKFVIQNKVEVVLLNCVPEQKDSYMKLGFQPFTETFNYPGIGTVIPMALIVGDFEHLTCIGSPFAMLAGREELRYCNHVSLLQKIIHDNREEKIVRQIKQENKEILRQLFSTSNQLMQRSRKTIDSSKLRLRLNAKFGNTELLTSTS